MVARLESGGADATADELVAIVGAGVPRADVEATLGRARSPAARRAEALLARTETRERGSR
jgi:hypothetical protein